MPIMRSRLGPAGEQLLADSDDMIPVEGDTIARLNFMTMPWDPASPVVYQNWDHYLTCCVTATQRARNAGTFVASETPRARA